MNIYDKEQSNPQNHILEKNKKYVNQNHLYFLVDGVKRDTECT